MAYQVDKNKIREAERKAKDERFVKLGRGLFVILLITLLILNSATILMSVFSKAVMEEFRLTSFYYFLIVSFFWIIVIWGDIVLYFLFTKVRYDDDKIVVKKLFCKSKEYYYTDIVDYTYTGNLKVKTTKGNFFLFAVCLGTSALRDFIIQKRLAIKEEETK